MQDNPSPSALSRIRLQVMWNRLLAIVEEQAQTLIRAAFSTTTREAGDLSAGLFDRRGRMLAQAVTGTPGHVNAMAAAVPHFLTAYPLESMQAGDAYITNDPWLTSGHLHDITVVTPVFFCDKPVGLFAATIHLVDIGGRGLGADGRQIYEEGLSIPIMALARRGLMNQDLLAILRVNTRAPAQVEGDVYSCVAAGEAGARSLVAMMRESAIDDLETLGEYIIDQSRSAMLRAIGQLQPGTYHNAITIDGYEAPVTVQAALTVSAAGIHVDYSGTSGPSQFGINVVMNYTAAYTSFGVKCALGCDVPNNFGSLQPITIAAPDGCILNVRKPAPVAARHSVGQITADTVLGCMNQAFGRGLLAEGGGIWNPMLRGTRWFGERDRAWELYMFFSGGMGARGNKDGLSTTQFPSGARATPIEIAEATAPVIFWRKELRQDSGGAGEYRGGLGQVLEIGSATTGAIDIQAMFDRVNHPARGWSGGQGGARGQLSAGASRPSLAAKGQHQIGADEILRLEIPGGGGFGEPLHRAAALVVADVRQGYVSPDAAAHRYGVIVDECGNLDSAATQRERAGRATAPS